MSALASLVEVEVVCSVEEVDAALGDQHER